MKTFLRVPTSVVLAAAMGLPGAIHAHDAGDDSPPLSAGAAFRDERAGMQHVLSAEQLDRLRGKAARAHKPYDQPMQAAAFFVKQRVSGGAESIDPLLYEAAKRQAEQLPLFSSALGRVLDGAESETPVRAALDQWTALGPGNVGGRTRVLKFRPGTPSTMYTGGVAGGIWRSTDSGASWTPLGDLAPNIAVTAMAIDPLVPDRMFVGTGEGWFNVDGVQGGGIYQSLDGGSTWTLLANTACTAVGGNFCFINDLVISPQNANRLYAATRTGLFRTLDVTAGAGGGTWTQEIAAPSSGATPTRGCTNLAVPTQTAPNDTLVVACGHFAPAGTNTGIWRSTAANTATPAWSKRAAPSGAASLPITAMGRTSLAVAPSATNTIYALVACSAAAANQCGTGNVYDDGLRGVYRSTDGGATWAARYENNFSTATNNNNRNLLLTNPVIARLTTCGFGTTAFYNQGWYDNTIAVDPADPARVWVGGIDLWRSDDSGVAWGVASYWWFTNGVDAQYAHADQHGIWFHPSYNGTTNQTMYVTNDGGIQRSVNARAAVGTNSTNSAANNSLCGNANLPAVQWTSLNNSLAITQFYDGEVYPNGTSFFGGTQDNGTNCGASAAGTDCDADAAGANDWEEINGGDGGYVAINPAVPATIYSENTGISIQRSTDNGVTWADIIPVDDGDATPLESPGEDTGQFINPFVRDPNSNTRLWTSGTTLWRADAAGTGTPATWVRASSTALTGGVLFSAIAVAPGNSNLVLAGTDDGRILRTTVGTSATSATVWTSVDVVAGAATGEVSSIAFDPNTTTTPGTAVAFATISTFSTAGNAVAHVLRSNDGGQTWSSIDGSGANAFPNVPAHSVVVDPNYFNGTRVYVGSDLGVFVTLDSTAARTPMAGAVWARENSGFANTVVEDLVLRQSSRELFAFTHGRGAFKTSLRAATVGCSAGSVAIPDNSPAGATLSVTTGAQVAAPATTIDLDVRVGLSHPRIGDLRASLTHVASGTTVELFNRPGTPVAGVSCSGSGDDVDAIFDDDADVTAEQNCVDANVPSLSGRFRANASLTAFGAVTQNVTNQWRLNVFDEAGTQVGTITSLCVTPTASVDATVPATLTHMSSQRLSAEQVRVTFQAGAEVGVVAYELVDSARAPADAGVKVAARGDSLRPRTYEFVGSVRGETFWIRTLDVDGRHALKGPFAVGQDSGEWRDGDGSDIDWAAVRAQLAEAPRAPTTAGDRVDLLVTRAGIQRVSFEAVAAGGGAGLQGVPVAELALSLRGAPVPIRVFDDDGSFGAGDAIEFVGAPLARPGAAPSPHDSLYSGTARYRLSRDAALAARMWRTRSASGDIPPPADIVRKRRFEDNTSYFFSSSLADPWTWRRVVAVGAPASSDVALVLPDLDPARPARMSVAVQGGLTVEDVDPDHHVVVQVNGAIVADLRFDGLSAETIDIDLPAGLLQVGANTVRIEAPGDNGFSADVVYLEDIALDHAAVPTAEDGMAEFAVASGQAAAPPVTPEGVVFADGFDASASNCDGCRLLAVAGIGATHRIVLEHAGATYWVDDAVTDAQGVRFVLPVSIDDRFVVANTGALLQPAVAPAANVAALDHAGGAAYVAIASPSLAAALQPLLQAKQAQGLSTHVVTTDAIYERYAHGVPDGEAIRRFIADAQRDWGTRYVLLAGGDSYDYRDELGLGTVSHVPTLYRPADAIVRFAASDAALADTDGDGVADVALGRFPARTPAELERMVAKSLAFEGNASGNALFVADADDGGFSFASRTEEQSGNFAGYGIQRAYRDDYPGAIPGTYDDAGMHAEIVSSFEAGVRLVHFFGHSASPQWTSGAVLTSSQLRAGALANTTMPLVAQWGCWNGYFVDPYANSLAQVFLAIEQGGGAAIGASGLTSAEADQALASAFYQELVKPGARVGDALLLARQALAAQQPALRDVQVAVNLFGDPAARFGATQ
jgi:hypothetical protein